MSCRFVGLGWSEASQVSLLNLLVDLLQLLTRIFDVLCFFQALAEALKTNSSVRDMNLLFNDIGPEGAQARPVLEVLVSLA